MAEGTYWAKRMEQVTITRLPPQSLEGDYIYVVVNTRDYIKMTGNGTGWALDESGLGIPSIMLLPDGRTNYTPMNFHFTARDVMARYIGLMESHD